MEILLSIAVDPNSDQKTPIIRYMSKLLEDAFRTRDYNIINHYWILCQVQKTIPGLEHFTKIPRHRFVEKLHFRNLDNSYTDLSIPAASRLTLRSMTHLLLQLTKRPSASSRGRSWNRSRTLTAFPGRRPASTRNASSPTS